MANMKSKKVAVDKKKLAADKKKVAADKKKAAADAKKVAADKKKVAADKKKVAADKKELAADKKYAAYMEKNLARIEAERAVRAKSGSPLRRPRAAYSSVEAEMAANRKRAMDLFLTDDEKLTADKRLAADQKLAADAKKVAADKKKLAADKEKVAADKKKVAADKKKLAADKEKNLARIKAERAVRTKFGTSLRRRMAYHDAKREIAADRNSARAESRMPADSAIHPLASEWEFKTVDELRKYMINPAIPLGNRLELLKVLGTLEGGKGIRALRSVGDYAGYPPNVLKRHALLLLDKIEKAKKFYGEDIMAKVKAYVAKDDTPEKLAILGVKARRKGLNRVGRELLEASQA